MSWGTLFERSAEVDVTVADIRSALSTHRAGGDPHVENDSGNGQPPEGKEVVGDDATVGTEDRDADWDGP